MVPQWLASLDDEDISFIRRFLLASGSLKEMARQYQVTYPTVRLRLDRLIRKIQAAQEADSDPYVALVKDLAIREKMDYETAKILISAYKKTKTEETL